MRDGWVRPGFGTGAVAGLLLTASLVAILYAAWATLGLPFVPFNLFDWATRRLSGQVVTAGIDAMVVTIRALKLGNTSQAAKLAEQLMAIGGFLAGGAILGALFFGFLRVQPRPRASGIAPGTMIGALLGIVLGAGAAFIGVLIARPGDVKPMFSVPWVLVASIAWGTLLGASRQRLSGPRTALPRPWSPEPTARPEPASVEMAPRDRAATDELDEDRAGHDGGVARTMLVERIDRRSFLLRMGAATAVITVSGAFVGALASGRQRAMATAGASGTAGPAGSTGSTGSTGPNGATSPAGTPDAPRIPTAPWSSDHPLPNAGDATVPAPGTRPEVTQVRDHYRTDIDTMPARVDAGNWRLRIDGLVGSPRELTLQEIRDRYPPVHQFITLACISNPVGGDLIGTTRWTGVSLQHVLPDLDLRPAASHLKITSADGYYEVVPIATIQADPRVMLTYAWDGLPLTAVHGFPLRIYIPNLYGMKQPKWIDRIEAIERWEAGYWVERGWDRKAEMKSTSVIDTVAVHEVVTDEAGRKLVPIGGIAHAGDRGIAKVELQVDEGPWTEARLRAPLSETTWSIWRLDWPFTPGRHTFTVRCTDRMGTPQIVEPAPPHPSGASGLHSVRKKL